jgi:hypothetical protein
MAHIRPTLPVKLFVAILTSVQEMVPQAEERLAALYGPVDSRSGPYPFDSTRYYDAEMGSPLRRYFLSFADLIDPAEIGGIKIRTNELESFLASRCPALRRPVNLDPGYLEQSKIVLASTKNYFHRILLSEGIYAEVTLHFEQGRWRPFPWTFPDYKVERYHGYFSSLRDIYRSQLRDMGVPIRGRRSGPAGLPVE